MAYNMQMEIHSVLKTNLIQTSSKNWLSLIQSRTNIWDDDALFGHAFEILKENNIF